MRERVVPGDDTAAACWAGGRIADLLTAAVAARGRASLALSGGRSPWVMMGHLFARDLPWGQVDILQVDERVAPDGDPQRNWTHIAPLLAPSRARAARTHPMRVADGAATAIADYRQVLDGLDGPIDVVHLGLGVDGHTASLAPGDPVLEVTDAPVASTARPVGGTPRVTLTYPSIDAARHAVWLITGDAKAAMASRMERGDPSIPAGRIATASQVIVLDRAAAGDA